MIPPESATQPSLSRFRAFYIVGLIAVIAIGWACYTRHVWEDYYITYRASKNLATGHGLVFTEGQRIHSFTSPLGVLLPALSSLIVLNQSDTAALWIFRLMSVAALGGAAALLYRATTHSQGSWLTGLVVIGLLATDNKIIDYTINGMETGILLFFLGWLLWTLFTQPRRLALHLGLSWAGLMWSRPDACIYIAAIMLPSLVFQPTRQERMHLLKASLRGAVIATICYLPWFVFAWTYYGTPIPHTVIAKGLFSERSLGSAIQSLIRFPLTIYEGKSTMAATFVPAYGLSTGWPAWVAKISFGVSLITSVLWLLPRVGWKVRATSFAFLVGHFYLTTIVGFPIPWYIPIVTALGIVALAMTCGQIFNACGKLPASSLAIPLRRGLALGAIALVCASATLASFSAYHFRWQQRLVETGLRQRLGEWLAQEAHSSQDTVFLEPLGYIGFFSNLKMLDYPGLSSPEVISARKKTLNHSYPFSWAELITHLRPDWVVLRPFEREYVINRKEFGFEERYHKARVFDVTDKINAMSFMPGRGYLLNDAIFEVYRRNAYFAPSPGDLHIITPELLTQADAFSPIKSEAGIFYAHAPSILSVTIPAHAIRVQATFGLTQAAYASPSAASDGADFSIVLVRTDGTKIELDRRLLEPMQKKQDRTGGSFDLALPENTQGTINFMIGPGRHNSNAYDWTYWTDLQFKVLPPQSTPTK